MQPSAYPLAYEKLVQHWQHFIVTGQVTDDTRRVLDPIVLQSWQRCAPRLQAYALPTTRSLQKTSLEALLRRQADLVEVGAPTIEDIYQYIEGSGAAVLLTDGTATVLAVTGDEPAVKMLQEMGLGVGGFWSEGQIGTNGFGTGLIAATPVQVVAAEHYVQTLHHLASTAAPVHAVNGRIIGLIGVVAPVERAHPHTLGLVMAAARSLSNQLHANHFLNEASQRLTIVNTIVETIHEGVITWDTNSKITHANARAASLLHFAPVEIQGRMLDEVLRLPARLRQAIQTGQALRDVESRIEYDGYTADALVTLHPIRHAGMETVGYVMILRNVADVRELIQQQVGMEASLTLDDVASLSASMRPVMRQALVAARGTAPVLFRGEGGVGKNHLARAIHNAGERANKPFITINCQAIPHELMVSEFLGHERDNMLDARPSKFELATGGTLMLDQIDGLSLEMQATLLQVIETGHVMRLGSMRPTPVNVRIMAATSADIEQRVMEGRFLPNLYYRFGVFNIAVPPLRQRVEDVPVLAERYLGRISQRFGRAAWIQDEALAVLRRYPWPGNVRELESVLERALAHSRDDIIQIADLPEAVRQGRALTGSAPRARPVLTTAEAEREAIISAGYACGGHVSDMAQQLGIGRTTLWRKMKRYQINREQFRAH
jgi:transcriptional activator for dhaKLM operon